MTAVLHPNPGDIIILHRNPSLSELSGRGTVECWNALLLCANVLEFHNAFARFKTKGVLARGDMPADWLGMFALHGWIMVVRG